MNNCHMEIPGLTFCQTCSYVSKVRFITRTRDYNFLEKSHCKRFTVCMFLFCSQLSRKKIHLKNRCWGNLWIFDRRSDTTRIHGHIWLESESGPEWTKYCKMLVLAFDVVRYIRGKKWKWFYFAASCIVNGNCALRAATIADWPKYQLYAIWFEYTRTGEYCG